MSSQNGGLSLRHSADILDVLLSDAISIVMFLLYYRVSLKMYSWDKIITKK